MGLLNEEDKNRMFIEETETGENKASFWYRLFRTDENSSYSEIIIRGSVWVGMFLISLLALVIIFRDASGSPKEVLVLKASDTPYVETLADNDATSVEGSSGGFIFNSPSKVGSVDNNKNITQPQTNKKPTPSKNTSTKTANNNNTNNSATSSADNNTAKVANDAIASVILNNSVKNNTANINKESPTVPAPAAPTAPAKVKPEDKTLAPTGDAWLVSVYSASSLDTAKSRWQAIQKEYSGILKNKKAYFLRADIANRGTFYRVALGDSDANKDLPMFSTVDEAKSYCSELKVNGVNCFIIKVPKKTLVEQK